MTPERMAWWVACWVRLYTRDVPEPLAARRIEEIDADLHDQIAHERERGTSERRIARSVLSRMVRGLGADVQWRDRHFDAGRSAVETVATRRRRYRRTYRSGLALAVGTNLFLFWLIGAVGVIGVDGDPADRMFLGVFGVWIAGTVLARLRPRGMAVALLATACATAVVGAVAIVGEVAANASYSPWPKLLGLHAMFIVLFVAAALQFWRAARRRPA